jgi:hypothetical protein
MKRQQIVVIVRRGEEHRAVDASGIEDRLPSFGDNVHGRRFALARFVDERSIQRHGEEPRDDGLHAVHARGQPLGDECVEQLMSVWPV